MAGKRKKHLRYQVRKQGQETASSEARAVEEVTAKTPIRATKAPAAKAVVPAGVPSQLPPGEVAYVRRELRYILVIAAVVAVLYLVLWLLLSRTTIEQQLFQFLKIGAPR